MNTTPPGRGYCAECGQGFKLIPAAPHKRFCSTECRNSNYARNRNEEAKKWRQLVAQEATKEEQKK